MTIIRVVIADDHTLVRKGLCSLLEACTDIAVIGEAEDGYEAMRIVQQLHPDVVLMDITMPHLNGLEATNQIKKVFPQIKILALTMYSNEEYIHQALEAGASGYVIKQAAPAELISAIQAVHRGESFLSPSVSKTIIDEYLKRTATSVSSEPDRLTDREREILQLCAEGYSNQEIAMRLSISEKTVSAHRANLMEKLGIRNIAELVKYALRKGIIQLD